MERSDSNRKRSHSASETERTRRATVADLPSDLRDVVGGFLPPPEPTRRTVDPGAADFGDAVESMLAAERRNRLRVGALVLTAPLDRGPAATAALDRLLRHLSPALESVEVAPGVHSPGDGARFWEAVAVRLPRLRTLRVAASEFADCDAAALGRIAAALSAAPNLRELRIAPRGHDLLSAVCALNFRVQLWINCRHADATWHRGFAPAALRLGLDLASAAGPIAPDWDRILPKDLALDLDDTRELPVVAIGSRAPSRLGRFIVGASSLRIRTHFAPDPADWERMRPLAESFSAVRMRFDAAPSDHWSLLRSLSDALESAVYRRRRDRWSVLELAFNAGGLGSSGYAAFAGACDLLLAHHLRPDNPTAIPRAVTFTLYAVHPTLRADIAQSTELFTLKRAMHDGFFAVFETPMPEWD